MPQAFAARAYNPPSTLGPTSSRGTYASSARYQGYQPQPQEQPQQQQQQPLEPHPPPHPPPQPPQQPQHPQQQRQWQPASDDLDVSSGRYPSPRDVRRDARTIRASGLYTIGLHAPPRENAAHRNPWGYANGKFHKGGGNQGHAPSVGAYHRSQNAVIVDGISDPRGEFGPPPAELEAFREVDVLAGPLAPPPPLSTTQVLNSGPHIGGDEAAAAEEAWQIAQSVGAGALETGPDPAEEQQYRARAELPAVTSAQVGSGPAGGGVELAEQMISEAAAAAGYHFERTAQGPYGVAGGLRRTSRPDVHFLASPTHAPAAGGGEGGGGGGGGGGPMGSTLQDFVHAKASGMSAVGGKPQVKALAVDSYWPNEKGVAAGHVPGGNNPLVGTGNEIEMEKLIEREKKVPNLWGHGGRTEDVDKREMGSIDDVGRYLSAIRDKPPSPPPKTNLAGEPVAQMLPDYPLPPPVPTVTPAGCVEPSTLVAALEAKKQAAAAGKNRVLQRKMAAEPVEGSDGYRGGSATAAATRAAEAGALAAQADAKLRDAQVYMATHTHQVWDPTTGSYAARKGKPLGSVVGPKLHVSSKPTSSLSYGGSRVILGDKAPAKGLVTETTMGQYGAAAPSRGKEEVRFSGVGHQTAGTGAPTRSC